MYELGHDDDAREDVGGVGNPVGQAVELLVEGSLDGVVDLCLLEDFSHFGGIAYLEDAHHAVALHDLGAAQHVVGGIGGFGVEVGGVNSLAAVGLACERGLVDAQRYGVKQFAVGRNLVSGVEDDDVSHHHVLARDGGHGAVAQHLYRLVVVYLVENLECLVGLLLEQEAQASGQQDGHEDADGLEEDFPILAEAEVLVEGDADREHSGDEQNDDERVGELHQELFPPRLPRWRGEYVGTVPEAALRHLRVCQAAVVFGL